MSFGEEISATWMQERAEGTELNYGLAKETLCKDVLAPVEELLQADVLVNPRLVMFGSSVTGPDTPKDLDVMLIYDDFHENAVQRTRLSSGAGHFASALQYYEMCMHVGSGEISGHISAPLVDIPIVRADTLEHYMTASPTENHMIFLNRMSRIFGRCESLSREISRHVLDEAESAKIMELADVAQNIPYLLLAVNGVDPTHYTKELLGELQEKRVVLDIPSPPSRSDQLSATIAARQINTLVNGLKDINPVLATKIEQIFNNSDGNVPQIEAKEALKELVLYCSDKYEELTVNTPLENAGYVVSKGMRQMTSTYNQGFNFIQAALKSGAVQIYGKSLTDVSGLQKLPYDNEILFVEDSRNAEVSTPPSQVWVELQQRFEGHFSLNHQQGEAILREFGKEALLSCMHDASIGRHDMWKIWRVVENELTEEDLPHLLTLMADSRVMSVDDRSLRGGLLSSTEAILKNMKERGVAMDTITAPDNLFETSVTMLLSQLNELDRSYNTWELAFMDLGSIIKICDHLNLDITLTPNIRTGDFNREFLGAYIAYFAEDLRIGSTMNVMDRALLVEGIMGQPVTTHYYVSQLRSRESADYWGAADSWGSVLPTESHVPRDLSSYTPEEKHACHFTYSGKGLSVMVYDKANYMSGIAASPAYAQLNEIIGDSNIVANIDFLPKGHGSFAWGNMTEALVEAYEDFQGLLQSMEDTQTTLKVMGGSTNPQMAAFAHRMGFRHIFLEQKDGIYPLTPTQLKKLADMRLFMQGPDPYDVKDLGIPQITTVGGLASAQVIVLGEMVEIKDKLRKLEERWGESKFFERAISRRDKYPQIAMEM